MDLLLDILIRVTFHKNDVFGKYKLFQEPFGVLCGEHLWSHSDKHFCVPPYIFVYFHSGKPLAYGDSFYCIHGFLANIQFYVQVLDGKPVKCL